MASITGVIPGLAPTPSPPKRAKPKPKAEVKVEYCQACEQELRRKDLKMIALNEELDDEDERFCLPCCQFFGIGTFHGVTNTGVEKSKERIAGAAADGWIMILKDGSFAAPGGTTFNVEKGDCFKVIRAGAEACFKGPDRKTTTAMFSIQAQVGQFQLTLWPHEFCPMSLTTLMCWAAEGELVVQYLSQEDETGYYTPTPEVREMIQNMFG